MDLFLNITVQYCLYTQHEDVRGGIEQAVSKEVEQQNEEKRGYSEFALKEKRGQRVGRRLGANREMRREFGFSRRLLHPAHPFQRDLGRMGLFYGAVLDAPAEKI